MQPLLPAGTRFPKFKQTFAKETSDINRRTFSDSISIALMLRKEKRVEREDFKGLFPLFGHFTTETTPFVVLDQRFMNPTVKLSVVSFRRYGRAIRH